MGVSVTAGGGPGRLPPSAAAQILQAFEQHPLVALSEFHGNQEFHDTLQTLLYHPAFVQTVDAIVVEFGNARYQALVDDFVLNRRPVPAADLRRVWRDTTQSAINSWDSPVYEQVFRAVRAVNLQQPPSQRKLRVLLGDPPIDWAKVKKQTDLIPFFDRDSFYAQVVQRDILAKGKKALLLAGGWHFLRGAGLNVTAQLDQRQPGATYVIWTHVGFPAKWRGVEDLLARTGRPALFSTTSAPLNVLSANDGVFGTLTAGTVAFSSSVQFRQTADALLFLVRPPDLTDSTPNPAIYRDPVYAQELLRRKTIMKGQLSSDPRAEMEKLLTEPGPGTTK